MKMSGSEQPSPSVTRAILGKPLAGLLLVVPLCFILFAVAFFCQASTPDYRALLHSMTPPAVVAIAGRAFVSRVFRSCWVVRPARTRPTP
jgi:hypothetical protein